MAVTIVQDDDAMETAARINGVVARNSRDRVARKGWGDVFRGGKTRGLVQASRVNSEVSNAVSLWRIETIGEALEGRAAARLTQQSGRDWSYGVGKDWVLLPLTRRRGDVEIDEIEVFAVEGW